MPDVRRIAVLRANALGDYLFGLPALESLRAAYPDAAITLLGAPWHARFLSGRPGPVSRVLVAPAAPGIREPGPDEQPPPDALDAFFARARAERFDLAIQLHGGGRHSNPFVGALGARLTAGLRADDAPPLDRWVRYTYYQPEVFRWLEAVALVGAAPVTHEPRLALTGEDRAEADRVLGPAARPRVALHPGATDPRRCWPARRFAEVGDALAAAGAEVLVTGTAAEEALVHEVLGGMRRAARPLVGALSIGGLAAAYAGCRLVLSNDTGPLHVAAAVGTPTLGLFWVGNVINGGPVYRGAQRALLSWTVHCPCCGADCTRDLYPERGGGGCGHRPSFVADIPVAEVLHEARDLLGW